MRSLLVLLFLCACAPLVLAQVNGAIFTTDKDLNVNQNIYNCEGVYEPQRASVHSHN